jgi:hypothetical protein
VKDEIKALPFQPNKGLIRKYKKKSKEGEMEELAEK